MVIRLWADDIRNPVDFLPDAEDWTWVRSVTEAIRILANENVEVVEASLDHDISHAFPIGIDKINPTLFAPIACAENFTAVAHYIAAMPPDRRPHRVGIHTANEIGADAIQRILKGRIEVLDRVRL